MSAAKQKKPGSSPQQAVAARRAAAEAKRAAADRAAPDSAFEPKGRPSDVFGGEFPGRADAGGGVRRRDMFSLLVLHLISGSEDGASYGNQLIDEIEKLTRGVVSLNPNTMYPLLRELETRGLVEGRWEHPEKRSRRLYRITKSGRAEYERLRDALEPFLDSIVESISLIKRAVYGRSGRAPGTGQAAGRAKRRAS